MEKINYTGTDEYVYYEKLENGIDIYMYPSDTAKNFYMTFNTRFGSMNTEYKYDNEKKVHKVPNGTAHFLEHQMFQEDNSETAFSYFAKLGSSVNAFTTYGLTCYEVIASNNFKENLNYLLDYVQNPVFKPDSIATERGIIKEEIKMYDNTPNAVLNFSTEYNLNVKDKHKYTISGTEDDIKKIHDTTLYDAYEAFYQPSNMFIVISGKFKPLEALGIIKENQSKKEFKPSRKVTTIYEKEPINVDIAYDTKYMDVNIPKISIAYKMDRKLFKEYSDLELRIYLDAILTLKFGTTSDFLERLESNNIVNFDINTYREVRTDYIVIYFNIESNYINEVIELIREELNNLDITKEEIDRIKKVNISNFILHFNDIISITEDIQDDIINYNTIESDILKLYRNLTKEKAQSIIDLFDTKNETILIIDRITK